MENRKVNGGAGATVVDRCLENVHERTPGMCSEARVVSSAHFTSEGTDVQLLVE